MQFKQDSLNDQLSDNLKTYQISKSLTELFEWGPSREDVKVKVIKNA